MIRTLNFALVIITGLTCLGLYRIAEAARVADADLRETRGAIVREKDAMTVLGAEWARVTQPARIEALAERHLDLIDKPAVELSALTQLPTKNPPLVSEGAIRNANDIVPAPDAAARPAPRLAPNPAPEPSPKLNAAAHTGT
jgi:cell division protein FtsL